MTKRVQEQKQRHLDKKAAEELVDEAAAAPDTQELKSDLDDVLDEIDSVLEENAQEFVDGYIQKGGE